MRKAVVKNTALGLKKFKKFIDKLNKNGLTGGFILTVLSSSVAEQVTVNHLVVGSTPT